MANLEAHTSNSFEISASSLHPDWAQDWGQTIRSPRNRKAILDNRRLAHRPTADLARQLDLAPLSGQPDDLHVLKVLSVNPARFLQVVGLASQASFLATKIDNISIRRLSRDFPLDDLKIAIACRDYAEDEQDTAFDMDQLGVVVRDVGPKYVMGWAENASSGIRGRVRLLLPKSLVSIVLGQSQPSVNHVPGMLVRRVAELIDPPAHREKPRHGGSW